MNCFMQSRKRATVVVEQLKKSETTLQFDMMNITHIGFLPVKQSDASNVLSASTVALVSNQTEYVQQSEMQQLTSYHPHERRHNAFTTLPLWWFIL